MSESSSFGQTLTGGIQDISALLPLIGTEQCEKHIGSALDGGYLYAAAAPLSIFGSPGIVKTGISVLVAAVSLPSLPNVSLAFTPLPKLSIRPSSRRILGARVLHNAGFEPVGSVAPMVGMDGSRFKAESRLLEMLEQKHIDSPENLTVEWTTRKWNIGLILCTAIMSCFAFSPYIKLTVLDSPGNIRLPWGFPLLRIIGSSIAAICCQFLTQSRIVSLMKNRIIFMEINKLLLNALKKEKIRNPEFILQNQDEFIWSDTSPSEECLSSLKLYLTSASSNGGAPDQSKAEQVAIAGNGIDEPCFKPKDAEGDKCVTEPKDTEGDKYVTEPKDAGETQRSGAESVDNLNETWSFSPFDRFDFEPSDAEDNQQLRESDNIPVREIIVGSYVGDGNEPTVADDRGHASSKVGNGETVPADAQDSQQSRPLTDVDTREKSLKYVTVAMPPLLLSELAQLTPSPAARERSRFFWGGYASLPLSIVSLSSSIINSNTNEAQT